jgi:hypothetical protein
MGDEGAARNRLFALRRQQAARKRHDKNKRSWNKWLKEEWHEKDFTPRGFCRNNGGRANVLRGIH